MTLISHYIGWQHTNVCHGGTKQTLKSVIGANFTPFLLFVTKVADSLVFSIEKLSVRTRAQLTFSYSKHCTSGAIKMLLCQEEAALLS